MARVPDDIGFPREGRCFGSKSGYVAAHKANRVVFNANVVTRGQGKIWHGDLDLAVDDDRAALQRLADRLGEPVHVLYEMDCRFDTDDAPRFERAVAVFEPSAA